MEEMTGLTGIKVVIARTNPRAAQMTKTSIDIMGATNPRPERATVTPSSPNGMTRDKSLMETRMKIIWIHTEPGETSTNKVETNTIQVISSDAPVNVDIDANGDGDIGVDTPAGEMPGEESSAMEDRIRSEQSQCG